MDGAIEVNKIQENLFFVSTIEHAWRVSNAYVILYI